MTLRKGHGNGAGEPRIEVMPPDELPEPVPATAAPLHRRPDGTIATSETAKHLGAMGGRARAERARLTSAMGLSQLSETSVFAPYRAAGDQWVRQHLAELSTVAGGEDPGPGPSSIVASAGVQLAASRYFSDRASETCDPALFTLASSLANASRQNLLAAYELAVREGQARKVRAREHSPWLQPVPKTKGKTP